MVISQIAARYLIYSGSSMSCTNRRV